MAKFKGNVGFLYSHDDQTTGLPWEEVIEKTFYGSVLEHSRNWQPSDTVTDDLRLGNQISIVATDYAFRNASAIAYVCYMGGRWTVSGMRIKSPEIILTLGGVYNGPIPDRITGSP